MIVHSKKLSEAPISLRERLLGFFISLSLVYSAWSFGGYENYSLHIFFVLSLLSFSCLFIPFSRVNACQAPSFGTSRFKCLIKHPFFWFSFCFLIYILIQLLNPSVKQVWGESTWWVETMPAPLGKNFPSSVQANYNEMNALRALVIHASALLLAVGIFVGIQRRSVALVALWLFMISATIMGFVAILQEVSGAKKILWFLESTNINFWGTFVYRNQGAAFLMLNIIVSGVLYFFYSMRASKAFKRGGPHFICFLFLFLSYGSIWLSLSRGGMILASILVLSFIALFFPYSLKNATKIKLFIKCILSFFILIIVSVFALQFTDFKSLERRFDHLSEIRSNFDTYSRVLSTKATLEMAEDRLKYGWGAGSFRYIFPIYQRNYEPIWYKYYHKKKGWMGRYYYRYAHNDWAQFLAEYGIYGCVPLGMLFLYLIVQSIFRVRQNFFSTMFLLTGLLLIFLHNGLDFIFSAPSYWVAFWGIMSLMIRLMQLESKSLVHPS